MNRLHLGGFFSTPKAGPLFFFLGRKNNPLLIVGTCRSKLLNARFRLVRAKSAPAVWFSIFYCSVPLSYSEDHSPARPSIAYNYRRISLEKRIPPQATSMKLEPPITYLRWWFVIRNERGPERCVLVIGFEEEITRPQSSQRVIYSTLLTV